MTVIDLHAHSTRSDGKESPTEVFEHAAAAGVNVLALTDHDTTDGWAEAGEVAARLGLGFVPGIELTTRARVRRLDAVHTISVHLLAYLPNPADAALRSIMGDSVASREKRAMAMVDKLSVDYEITWDAVLAELAHGATIGRPAIADALVTMGVVANRTEAFGGVLSKHGGYYIPTEVVDTIDAIKIVLNAGGVPVIAHPLTGISPNTERGDLPLEHFENLIDAGLAGFEVYHREVPEIAREWLVDLAAEHELVVTGSSDYHGVHGKPNRLGENSTSVEMFERIVASASGVSPQL
jgi:predicted metal-dependent phosphoesterase TrpH